MQNRHVVNINLGDFLFDHEDDKKNLPGVRINLDAQVLELWIGNAS